MSFGIEDTFRQRAKELVTKLGSLAADYNSIEMDSERWGEEIMDAIKERFPNLEDRFAFIMAMGGEKLEKAFTVDVQEAIDMDLEFAQTEASK